MLPQGRQTEAVTTAVPYSVWQHHPHGIGSDRMKDEVGGIVESCTTYTSTEPLWPGNVWQS